MNRLPPLALGMLLLFSADMKLASGDAASSATIVPARYQIHLEPDLARRRFSAQAVLDFEIAAPTREIVLDAAELEVISARVDGDDGEIKYDAQRQQLTITVPQPLARGSHVIVLRYAGHIGDSGPGLLRVIDRRQPEAEYLYSALCCSGRARYLAPMWDKVGSKAVFELQLTVAEHLDAVSTMPILVREPLGDGKVRVVFQATPPMTPRLFFLAVGPFERVSRRTPQIDVGIVVPRGHDINSALVLDTTVRAADYLRDYLGRSHPLPKLDTLLLPNAPGGAIANWGAIQYAQRYLTVNAAATRAELQIGYAIITHEVSHQWFGNLVTPYDASHAWLSEGFAVWLENKIGADLQPDWPSWLHASEYREAAMQLDGLGVAHPIVLDSPARDAAWPPYTEIVYDKGAQVLRMIEAYVGEQKFKSAVRDYLARHAYGSVVSREFWTALASVSSPMMLEIGTDFTEQSGVPLIDVSSGGCSDGGSSVILRQQRFGVDSRSRQPRLWRVPVSAMSVGQGMPRHVIVSGEAPRRLALAGCGAIKVNVGDIGYFRTRYDTAAFAAIRSAFAELPPEDQLGLLRDQYALAGAGYASFNDYLDLTGRLSAQTDPFVNLQWVQAARALDLLYAEGLAGNVFRSFARERFARLLHETGWEPRGGEVAHLPLLRTQLIELLGWLRHEGVHAEAERLFSAVGRSATKLSPALREPVMKVLGASMDLPTLDTWLELARRTDDAEERRLYWVALSSVRDVHCALRVLDLASTDVTLQNDQRSAILRALAVNHPEQVYKRIEARADPRVADQAMLLLEVALSSADKRIAQRLGRSLSASPHVHPRVLARVRSDILYRDDLRRHRLPAADTWQAQ